MKPVLRVFLWMTYPFLVLSGLILAGTIFTTAFIAEFTLENRTQQPLMMTPVGTVGRRGHKAPLPVTMAVFPALPAFRAGNYGLRPGEWATIRYDMDDINFSEILIEDEMGQRYQLIADPNPTEARYHGPLQQNYIIEDLSQLSPADPKVVEAAKRAQSQRTFALAFYLLVIGPWLAYCPLLFLIRACDRNAAPSLIRENNHREDSTRPP